MRTIAALGRRMYCYHFNRVSPGALATRDLAKHTSEIRYVFGNLTSEGAYDERDRRVSELMQAAWIAFARSGVPEDAAGMIWPRYDAAAPQVAWIADDVTRQPFRETELMRAINSTRSV